MTNVTREHILETSLILFLQKSFKAVTMKEIVKETGLSKGAFYHYFKSKEQLFAEVVKHFYVDIFVQDLTKYPYGSLKEFYERFLRDVNSTFLSIQKIGKNKKMIMDLNHYLIIFDAMTLLPHFRGFMQDHNEEEIKCWEKVIRIAKDKGEIDTPLSVEQIARMFYYMGDGFGLHVIVNNAPDKLPRFQKDLKTLWDDFYNTLKPKP